MHDLRPVRRTRSAALHLVTCALLLAPLAGCGEREGARLAPVDSAAAALGATDLLARLRQRVVEGTALNDRSGSEDASQLRALLWASGAPGRGPDLHQMLVVVAGAIARELTSGEGARERVTASDPVSVEIHDAWVAAAAQGPDAYRTWCEGEGARLFERLEQERQKLFDRPLR